MASLIYTGLLDLVLVAKGGEKKQTGLEPSVLPSKRNFQILQLPLMVSELDKAEFKKYT